MYFRGSSSWERSYPDAIIELNRSYQMPSHLDIDIFKELALPLHKEHSESGRPFLVTLNPPRVADHVLLRWNSSHPVPSVPAAVAAQELHRIQRSRGLWFCGAYQGYGFHEDGLKAGKAAVRCRLPNPKQMVPSRTEATARLLVARFSLLVDAST
ncbi:hypothetical protein ABZP36_024538 [Zizania latifolia]